MIDLLEQTFTYLLIASRDAAILAFAIAGVLMLCGSRLPAKWRHALWLLVALRLLLPVLPSSQFSWQTWFPQESALVADADSVTKWRLSEHSSPLPIPFDPAPSKANVANEKANLWPELSWYSVAALIWLSGSIVFGLVFLLGWLRLCRLPRRAREASAETSRWIETMIARLAREENIAPPRVVISSGVGSPAIFGVFRATLLIPEQLCRDLGREQICFVLRHELAHLKRRDTMIQALLCLLQGLHWFNPMVRWAFRRIRMESERATDSLVLARSGPREQRAYGETLLRVIELCSPEPRTRSMGALGVAESATELRNRLIELTKSRSTRTWLSAFVAVSALALLATVGLTQAPSKPKGEFAERVHAHYQKLVKTEELPDDLDETLLDELSKGDAIAIPKGWREFAKNPQFGRKSIKLSIQDGYRRARDLSQRLDGEIGRLERARYIQAHRLEVSRAYWSVYFARLNFHFVKERMDSADEIISQLEQKLKDDPAWEAELPLAKANATKRKAEMLRAKIGIRNAEERLRALLTDDVNFGLNHEVALTTEPLLSWQKQQVREVSLDALNSRPESLNGFLTLQTAIDRALEKGISKEKIESILSELVFASLPSTTDSETEESNSTRTELDLRQQVRQLDTTVDTIQMEARITLRESASSYLDLQRRAKSLKEVDEVVNRIREQLDGEKDFNQAAKQYRRLSDVLEQQYHERTAFIDAVVAYNASLQSLDRARGKLAVEEK